MLRSEVINKLARECCMAMGDFYYYKTVRTYIQMALAIGIEHFNTRQEEIVVMDKDGIEAGRFKSIMQASKELGLQEANIRACLHGRQHTCGGLMFMKTTDYELIKRTPEGREPCPEFNPKPNLILP